MKIGLIQTKIHPDVSLNLKEVKKAIIEGVHQNAEIFILPEMWNCPYVNEMIRKSVSFYEESKALLQELSGTYGVWIIGGTMAHQVDDQIYNECLIFDHGKPIASYAKTHLFEVHTAHTSYREKDVFTPGNHLQTFSTPWGKMGILICYDIRFPEISRLLAQEGAQILFCPAAFNKTVTQIHWTPLFQVRAMENQVFCVGVNPAHYTYGTFESNGHSIVTDPFGQIVCQMDEKPGIQIVDIQLDKIQSIRKRMPFWQIRRTDLYTLEETKYENH